MSTSSRRETVVRTGPRSRRSPSNTERSSSRSASHSNNIRADAAIPTRGLSHRAGPLLLLLLAAGLACVETPEPPPPSLCPSSDVFARADAVLDPSRLLATADLNGDSTFEVVAADPLNNAVHVAYFGPLNDVTAPSVETFQVGEYPVDVAIADVDLDNCLDLITANFRSSDISIIPCPADPPSPAPERRIPAGSGPRAVEVLDIDGDGLRELVVYSAFDGAVSAFSLHMDGTFDVWDPLCLAPGGGIFGDGNISEYEGLLLANTEKSTLASLLADDQIVALGFVKTVPSPGQIIESDIDSDGEREIVVRGLFGALGLHERDDNGHLRESTPLMSSFLWRSVAAADLNADGLDELTGLTSEHGLLSIRPDGRVHQRAASAGALEQDYSLLAFPSSPETGVSSYLGLAGRDGLMQLYRAVPAPSFSPATSLPSSFAGKVVSFVEDLTGDGVDDIVLVDDAQTSAALVSGDDIGMEPIQLPLSSQKLVGQFFSGRLNDDAVTDLLFFSSGDNNFEILEGMGDGHFAAAEGFSPPSSPVYIAVGDVTDDAISDLVLTTALPEPDSAVVFLGDGDFHFDPAPVPVPGVKGRPWLVKVDSQGPDDMLFEQLTPIPSYSIVRSLGDGKFSVGAPVPLNTTTGGSPLVLDVNFDGWPDILGCAEGTSDTPPGLLMLYGASESPWTEVVHAAIRNDEIPGAPVGATLASFSCDGILAQESNETRSLILYGTADYDSGQRIPAILGFGSLNSAPTPTYFGGDLLHPTGAELVFLSRRTHSGVDLIGVGDGTPALLFTADADVGFIETSMVPLLLPTKDGL